jgi:hypothetical protein
VAATEANGIALVLETLSRKWRSPELRVEVPHRLRHVAPLSPKAMNLHVVTLGEQLIEGEPVLRQVVGDERNGHGLDG